MIRTSKFKNTAGNYTRLWWIYNFKKSVWTGATYKFWKREYNLHGIMGLFYYGK